MERRPPDLRKTAANMKPRGASYLAIRLFVNVTASCRRCIPTASSPQNNHTSK